MFLNTVSFSINLLKIFVKATVLILDTTFLAFFRNIKIKIKSETVSLNDFPSEIQKLGATHAENFLCIYKDCLS